MFFSVDILCKQKNRRGRLPLCWLAAMGANKLRKKEIEGVDIPGACDDITELMTGPRHKRMSLRTTSQLAFGALTIFRKQVLNLEIECRELLKNLWDDLLKTSQHSSIPSTVERTEKDIIDLFPQDQVDRNQILDPSFAMRGSDFGDLPSFFDNEQPNLDIRMGPSTRDLLSEIDIPPFMQDPETSAPINEGLREEPIPIDFHEPSNIVPLPRTPKRKSQRPHDETPTKRRPGNISDHGTPSRLRTGIPPVPSSPSESARSPVPNFRSRKSLLLDFAWSDSASESLGSHLIPQGNLIGEPQDLADRFSIPTETIIPPRIVSLGDREEPMDQEPQTGDVPTEIAHVPPHDVEMPQVDLPPAPVPPANPPEPLAVPSVPPVIPSVPLVVPPVSEDELKLNELDDESLDLQRRRRSKAVPMFDTEKQISLKIETTAYTRKNSGPVKKSYKILAMELLTLPATGLRMISNLKNKPSCIWSAELLDNFGEQIVAALNDTQRARQHSSRSTRRFTEIDIQRTTGRSSTAHPSSSGKSSLHIPAGPVEKDLSNADHDQRMPPAPAPLSDAQEQQDLPHVSPGRNIEKSTNEQRIGVPESIMPEPEDIPEELRQRPFMPEPEDIPEEFWQQSRPGEIPVDSRSETGPSSVSSLITIKDLRIMVEKMWRITEKYQKEGDDIEIELDILLPPAETIIQELVTCILHLCQLEFDNVLELRQEIPYDTIFIKKVQSESQIDSDME